MEYYLNEQWEDTKTALVKARADINSILSGSGMRSLEIRNMEAERLNRGIGRKLAFHMKARRNLEKVLRCTSRGDVLYIQFPILTHSVFYSGVFRRQRKKGVRLVSILHDYELLRKNRKKERSLLQKLREKAETGGILKYSNIIIVHNEKMKEALHRIGLARKRMILLGIFDYLPTADGGEIPAREYGEEAPVVIAGNLSREKAGYAYLLPEGCVFYLYGTAYTGVTNESIVYRGAFPSDALPDVLEGAFGLVWDGPSPETCSGVYGEYLRINNPHKTSLYLAAGIPVIIWKKAALADFIEENGCGLCISSLYDLASCMKRITPEQYARMQKNAMTVGKRLREGHYTKRVIHECRRRTDRKRA